MPDLVIIGNGITGITAAREVRKKSDVSILVISEESEHFYSRPALMYIYMGHMKYEHTKPYEDFFWNKNRIALKKGRVISVIPGDRCVKLASGEEIPYKKLVIATGSQSNRFGWEGENLHGVCGLYNLQDLQTLEQYSDKIKTAVLVGGGLIGVELAEMLRTRGKRVIMLVRENHYWGNILDDVEGAFIEKHIASHGVKIKTNTQLEKIIGDTAGNVAGIITSAGEQIECEYVGLTAGVRPNIGFLDGSGIRTNRGVLVNNRLETNFPDIYAAGDCAELEERQSDLPKVEQLWYTGRMQAEVLARNILGSQAEYERGILFNSAKFFDIEYQTYGTVKAKQGEDDEVFYWQEPSRNLLVKIVWSKSSGVFKGINTFGIRMRHKVFETWLKDQVSVEYISNNLGAAMFDPEFYRSYTGVISKQLKLYIEKNYRETEV